MKKTLVALAALGALCANGCGSFVNATSGDFYPYGGVERDFSFIFGDMSSSSKSSNSSDQGKGGFIALLILLPTEVTASFLCDTAMLPITLYYHPAENKANYNSVDGHGDEEKLTDIVSKASAAADQAKVIPLETPLAADGAEVPAP